MQRLTKEQEAFITLLAATEGMGQKAVEVTRQLLLAQAGFLQLPAEQRFKVVSLATLAQIPLRV